MVNLTAEQRAAIDSRGKVIVSASAGSGKTFVMIEKLVNAIVSGADLDEVLAVTFTKKAAAQMKEKLRQALIKRLDGADADTKSRLKLQLSKIPSSNISTIHALCAKLIRTYFYVLGIDGGFDIISSDDATAKTLKARAADGLFERLYDNDDKDFLLLLSCFRKKRTDAFLKKLLDEAYTKVRATAHYEKLLSEIDSLYSESGFKRVCEECSKIAANRFKSMIYGVQLFESSFPATKNAAIYTRIFGEMKAALEESATLGIFESKPELTKTRKPNDPAEDKEAGESFKKFKTDLSKRFSLACGDIESEQNEFDYFMKSGEIAKAFARVLLQLDREYAEVKRDENKLDYNDLEHLTLELLSDESVKEEISAKFKYVFVDEYQDVNPVQEEIISAFGGEVFLVGDVKQAIYGFRGSKSLFFAEKYESFLGGGGTALRLSSNFRSTDGVLGFVNKLFSDVMREQTCGFNYAENSVMRAGGQYTENSGEAHLHIFGKEEKEERELKVYSVMEDGAKTKHTREGLAVLSIVESELQKQHYDLKSGAYVNTQPGDICILTRKNKGGSAEGIVKTLRDEGYSVSGAQEGNICTLPEVKQFLDILSLIDNAEQDMPLVSALLSPLGGFTEDELAEIRITVKDKNRISFRECCKRYAARMRGKIADKLISFVKKLERLRALSEIVNAGELADEILEGCGLEAEYAQAGGEKLKNVLKLVAEGANLTLNAFLDKVKSGGFDISAPSSAASDSIKIMTMHASKGLEFPVVIIADVCRTFKGENYSEMSFDGQFGFAPKCYDRENMLTHKTVLRRLCKLRADGEELKNELNLFYVACTRAMCRLHILAEEVKSFDPSSATEARCYADTFDMSRFSPEEILPHAEIGEKDAEIIITEPDSALAAEIDERFMKGYAHADSVDLPVKSSASAILRVKNEEPYYTEKQLFGGEDETGTERGTAYHRFLELCDFSLKFRVEIERELNNFLQSGRITDEQFKLLNADELSEILNMPVFADISGATLFKEQEFLCRLPANEILEGVTATDGVLIQGAIDLIARGDFGIKIIDYKYSHKTDEQLIETYSRQLALYKKAVAKIMKVDEKTIGTAIINIFKRRQIIL